MTIYWSAKSVPELAELPKEERRRVLRETQWKTFRDWQAWAFAVPAGLVLVGIMELAPSIPERGPRLVALISAVVVWTIAVRHVALRLKRPYIREALARAPATRRDEAEG